MFGDIFTFLVVVIFLPWVVLGLTKYCLWVAEKLEMKL